MASSPIDPEKLSQVSPLVHPRDLPSVSSTSRSAKENSSAPTDRVKLSNEIQKQQGIQEALRAIPDTRSDRINTLREAIESGSYSVAAQDVADKVIRETILDNLP